MMIKSGTRQTASLRPRARTLITVLALVSVIGGLVSQQAFSDDDRRGRGQGRDRGGEHRHWDRHDNRGNNYSNGYYYNGYRPEYRRPYRYAQPVYIPPPIYYEPLQSPGISFFFPFEFRR